MHYRHFYCTPKLQKDSNIYSGRISDLPEVGVIMGDTLEDFEENFHMSVDEYLRAEERKNSKSRKRLVIWLLSILFIFVIMAITCPDKDKHVNTISDRLSVVINDEAENIQEDDDWAYLGAVIGNRILGAFIENAIHIDNYVLFNLGVIEYDDEQKIVSVGAFNHVFTVSRDEIRKRVEESGGAEGLLWE